jgi:putative Mn2+ efflux pump MntP
MLYIEIFLVAISLSLDAFSLALSIGLRNISKKEIKTYSVVVGLYHFIMPLMGFFMRLLINNFFTLPNKMIFISVIVFIIIGILIDKDKEINIISPIIFGFTVSIDSFSIGISLSKSYLLISILQFSIISSLLTYIGFKIADKMKLKFKNKSKYISILILIFILIYNIIK